MHTTYTLINYTTIIIPKGATYLTKREVRVSTITTSTTIIISTTSATITTIATYS